MGHCSRRRLLTRGEPSLEEVCDRLAGISGDRSPGEWEQLLSSERVEWPGRRFHMAEVSASWPESVLIMDIRGEDGQRFREYHEYHLAGLVQLVHGEILHPEFDPEQPGRPRLN